MSLEIATTENGEYRTLSASQLNKFYNCPRMWAFEYIEKIKPPPRFPMTKGSFIHAVVEEFNEDPLPYVDGSSDGLKQRLMGHMKEKARQLWKQGMQEPFDEEMRRNREDVMSQLGNYVDSLVRRFRALRRRTDLAPERAWTRAHPSANELSVKVTDPDGKPLFRGDVDAVFERHPLWFDRTAIIDYKTGKSPFNDESPLSVQHSRQLNIYAWLYYQAFGQVPEVAGIQFLAEDPRSSTAFVFQEIDPGTIESTHMMVQRVRRQLASESLEEYPRRTEYKWCEFEKNDGTMIRCDHWDYCLGDEPVPEPEDRGYDGPEREPIEVKLRDPLEDELALSEHASSVFEEA